MQKHIINSHAQVVGALERLFEWLVAIASMVALFPSLRQLFIYVSALIYEALIQYQYLF